MGLNNANYNGVNMSVFCQMTYKYLLNLWLDNDNKVFEIIFIK